MERGRMLKNILVTGGVGFIGSNFIRYLLEKAPGFSGRVINLDALTYAGNPASLADIEIRYGGPTARYVFEKGDIGDGPRVEALFRKYDIDTVVHFAAESHVDRSISGPGAFIKTNVGGTFTLLEAARKAWEEPGGGSRPGTLFHHVSTDEVYGSLGEEGYFTEESAYKPRSPYSASKAASDHLVMAYHHTYGLGVTVSNCSNNYGPYQFPEKLIPLMILNMVEGKRLPVYGDGKNVRDWIYVEDHNRGVWTIVKEGRAGERYGLGGENEWENLRLVHRLIDLVARKRGVEAEGIRGRIEMVKDRPGHDRRYAIDCGKIKRELGWERRVSFEEGLERTVEWYLGNEEWIAGVRSGEYRRWEEEQYGSRG
jgi:dTDP-glucose 4,6-dehydratase